MAGIEEYFKTNITQPWPITSKSEYLVFLVAGGHHPSHAYWMQCANRTFKLTRAEIKLPAKAKWNQLLKEAVESLGPISSV